MHIEVINEDARLTTVLIECDGCEIFDIEGFILQEDLASCSCFA